ncbi:DUF2264 domain-containing protein [Pedobacter sp. P351]|uniref:DUF2264 domain-containing protein n=1 Tax=Pedobacter superstes TaxID=3133441 RepID=UPI0030B4561E
MKKPACFSGRLINPSERKPGGLHSLNNYIQMNNVLIFIFLIASVFPQDLEAKKRPAQSDRATWLSYMDKTARPILMNLAENRLKDKMPVALARNIDNKENRTRVAYLEAFGRTLSGIGPWLTLEGGSKEEVVLRNQYRQWALKALANSVNPSAKDYMTWNGGQPLVDASFVALGLVRCPWLWENSSDSVKHQVITAFTTTRSTVPVYSNWILFSGMIEAFFCKYGVDYDKLRVEFGIREFAQHWYTGDGMFSDGMNFHMDYYNSYVIQPYLVNIVDILNKKNKQYEWFAPKLDKIAKRYAELQERMINSDGTFPLTGRSIVYRGGAFHHLADIAQRKALPESLRPAQVRGALTAVIKKTLGAPGSFTKDGWLTIGLNGEQPGLADFYITTGSLYLCTTIFLPLGLPDTDPFWSDPKAPWTSLKVWSGQDGAADHALDIK